MSKKKLLSLALVVIMIAILSFGTLAWFTDDDSVTNEFLVAGSDGEDAEDIFSVDVSEKSEDPDATETEDGIQYDKILPGDTLSKIVNVTNTGSYNQYIRVKIEVSNAALWQKIYQANMVPVTEFVDLDVNRTDLYGVGSYLEGDSFVYYLYFTEELAPEESMNVFNNAFVAGALTKEQAFDIDGTFTIKVSADAVQTENVGSNVYEAFKTVGMEIPVNTTFVETYAELESALAEDGYVVLMNEEAMAFPYNKLTVKSGVTVNLYLNGRTMSTHDNDENRYFRHAMYVLGNLTIGGHGTISMADINGIKVEGGTLNIYGGTFVDPADRTINHTESLINVCENGVLNVMNGTFNGANYCVCVRNATAQVNIWGGTFAIISDKGEAICQTVTPFPS